jgi:hypothetical protein
VIWLGVTGLNGSIYGVERIRYVELMIRYHGIIYAYISMLIYPGSPRSNWGLNTALSFHLSSTPRRHTSLI